MKKLTLILPVFIIAITSAISANAQQHYPDYVITTAGDSIPCNISVPFMGSMKYQGASMPKAVKVNPDSIKEYYISSKENRQRAVFKNNSRKPMFMTVIEKGKISLYEMVYTTYTQYGNTTTVQWYIAKGSDNVTDFKSSGIYIGKSRKARKDYLGDLLKDNQAVYDQYKAEDKFSFKQIQNLVHLYNTGQPLEGDN